MTNQEIMFRLHQIDLEMDEAIAIENHKEQIRKVIDIYTRLRDLKAATTHASSAVVKQGFVQAAEKMIAILAPQQSNVVT